MGSEHDGNTTVALKGRESGWVRSGRWGGLVRCLALSRSKTVWNNQWLIRVLGATVSIVCLKNFKLLRP